MTTQETPYTEIESLIKSFKTEDKVKKQMNHQKIAMTHDKKIALVTHDHKK